MRIARFYMVIFLTLIWCGLSSNFAVGNILIGLMVSLIVHSLITRRLDPLEGKVRMWRLIKLLALTTYELVVSSIQVAWDVLTIEQKSIPAIIKVKLDCKTDIEKMLLSNLISLTPGTLVISLSDDKAYLYIHAMFANDIETVKRDIKEKLEPRVMGVFDYGSR